jgi:hypothetical protein
MHSVVVVQRRIAMCIFGGRPKTPAVDPNVEIERENQQQMEQEKKQEAKAKALEETVAKKKKGAGGMSLLTGTKGGIGYIDETL